MSDSANLNLDYDRAINIAPDVYWIGFVDVESGLHCNPYLVVDHNEAVIIDGGSRPHFPVVMRKILQTGLQPASIKALIYQHYDPDLCAGAPVFEDIINRPDLMIISNAENNMFIRHYSVSSRLYSLDYLKYEFRFSSGRTLRFYNTPYAHAAGSFVTFDEKTGILFSSDIYGSYLRKWNLYLELSPECRTCRDLNHCRLGLTSCPLQGMIKFHQSVMPSNRALRYALEQISRIPFKMIAPQHGSVIHEPEDIVLVSKRLSRLRDIGIDRILGDRPFDGMGDISALEKRWEANG